MLNGEKNRLSAGLAVARSRYNDTARFVLPAASAATSAGAAVGVRSRPGAAGPAPPAWPPPAPPAPPSPTPARPPAPPTPAPSMAATSGPPGRSQAAADSASTPTKPTRYLRPPSMEGIVRSPAREVQQIVADGPVTGATPPRLLTNQQTHRNWQRLGRRYTAGPCESYLL